MKDLINELKNASSEIAMLEGKQTLASITEKLNELIQRVNEMESAPKRDRGPKSERQMTEDDAFRVKFGDLKDSSHKKAAEELNLSYGQIYSARNGYTFREVTEDHKISE